MPLTKRGDVLDSFKLYRSLKTIQYLQKQGARIILLSHLGEPSTDKKWFSFGQNKKYSLRPVALELEKILNMKIVFVKNCLGQEAKKAVESSAAGDILMLENLRLEKGEINNDLSFSRSLAELGDVYVGEAFSVCHREHASIVGLPKLLPHFVGFEFAEELKYLSRVLNNPERPLVVIIGGAKVEAKIKVVDNFLQKADYLLLAGKIANTILQLKGIALNESLPSDVVRETGNFDLTSNSLRLPVDLLVSLGDDKDSYVRKTAPASIRKGELVFDIGPETISLYKEIIKLGRTIFWSGDLGMVEDKRFRRGTEEIAKAITTNKESLKVAGGGETVAFIRRIGLADDFSYLSVGGSAMLGFLAGEKLPGLEALQT